MTNSYQGPAVVIADGVAVPVEADLLLHQESSGWKSWDGSLEADPSVDLFEAEDVVLRMPDGREGAFISTRSVLGTGRVEIQGSGPEPF